jgi:PDZ domain-containing protein
MRKRFKTLLGFITIGFMFFISFYIELPYFTTSPGAAIELAPIVSVDEGFEDERGTFMMTTVRTDQANLWEYLYAQISPNVGLLKMEDVLNPHEDVEEYFERQKAYMEASQQKAIAVAFLRAGQKIQIEERGAVLTNFIPGMPAEKVLKAGDVVIQVDERAIKNDHDLIEALKGKAEGERVKLKIIRKEKTMELTLELSAFPPEYQQDEGPKAGLGIIGPETKRSITPSKKVNFDTENIGGPSAGLMFTLELINQLSPGDLTKGYRIAGTGTIDIDGKVGRIGGIEYKIVAADREGAEIFFAPDDDSSAPNHQSNYDVALQTAKDLGLDLEVVPVKSIDDALKYLGQLPEMSKDAKGNSDK